jgi:hypothetical protein
LCKDAHEDKALYVPYGNNDKLTYIGELVTAFEELDRELRNHRSPLPGDWKREARTPSDWLRS